MKRQFAQRALKAVSVARVSVGLSELIGLGSLALTGEIRIEAFGIVATFFILSRLAAGRVSNWILSLLMAFVVIAGGSGWYIFHYSASVAAAHAVPLIHSVLWFAAPGNRNRMTRMALCFVELNLASAITPELYLSVSILSFAILASVAISSSFLDQAIRSSAPELGEPEISATYLRRSVGLSFMILLTSLLIFPILPRSRGAGGYSGHQSQVGYTEEVSLLGYNKISGVGGGSSIMHIYFPDKNEGTSTDLITDFYLGLIRGKVLPIFDGKQWSPAAPPKVETLWRSLPARSTSKLEIILEPINSQVLPVPYGTRSLWLMDSSASPLVPLDGSGEWTNSIVSGKTVRYQISLDTSHSIPIGSPNSDMPQDRDTFVPENQKTQAMVRLANHLFPAGLSEVQKVQRLLQFFRNGLYGVSSDLEAGTETPPNQIQLTPIEKFLFITKKGHCEYFASATAILLRMSGVPTRLVAGFRLSRGPVGGILNVRTGDAHAWVEYWVPSIGWRPVDPTPRAMLMPSLIDYFRDRYDFFSAYWARFIATFDLDAQMSIKDRAFDSLRNSSTNFERTVSQSISDYNRVILIGLCAMLLLAGLVLGILRIWFPHVLSIRWKVAHGPNWLKRERMKMEKLLRKASTHAKEPELDRMMDELRTDSQRRLFTRWLDHYYAARFGENKSVTPKTLSADRQEFVTELKRSA